MKTPLSLLTCAFCLSLVACGQEKPAETKVSEADNFAARINGNQPDQPTPVDPNAAPSVAQPRAPQALTQAQTQAGKPTSSYSPGTASDPNSACNANLFAEFLGQQPNADVRGQIMEAATDISEVRFVAPGSDYVKPDPTHPRLNVMIAVDGVIRDIRCG